MMLPKIPKAPHIHLRSFRITYSSHYKVSVAANIKDKKINVAIKEMDEDLRTKVSFRISVAGFLGGLYGLALNYLELENTRKDALSNSVQAIVAALGPELSIKEKIIVQKVASGLALDKALDEAWRLELSTEAPAPAISSTTREGGALNEGGNAEGNDAPMDLERTR